MSPRMASGVCGWLILTAGIIPVAAAAAPPTHEEVRSAMKRAATFYRDRVAAHGGYVYYYSPDLKQRWGEGVASADQIWVQPPGTPTVGLAFLDAYRATGDHFYLDAATAAARALIHGQLQSGAWTNCVDFHPRGSRLARYRNGKGGGENRNYSSLDDGTSQAALRLLMQVDQAHDFKDASIHESARIGLDALLAAQFPCGAFPQGWDETPAPRPRPVRASYPAYDWRTQGRIKNYWDMYTLNDSVAGTVAQTLIDAHRIYKEERFQKSLAALGDFLLLAQMPEPQPAWAQQYSYEMHPIWARPFEPAAITGGESQDVLRTLLTIYRQTGERKYLEPAPRALAYLRRSLLSDGQLARYYELKTNRPLYMTRQGRTYTLTYDSSRLPGHYGWMVPSRLDEIEADYNALKEGRKKSEGADMPNREAQVRAILESLEEPGVWISTATGERLVGQPKFSPGSKYISSAVFSENLSLLAQYLRAGR